MVNHGGMKLLFKIWIIFFIFLMMDMQFVDEVKHLLRHKCQVLDKGYSKIKWLDFTLDLYEKY